MCGELVLYDQFLDWFLEACRVHMIERVVSSRCSQLMTITFLLDLHRILANRRSEQNKEQSSNPSFLCSAHSHRNFGCGCCLILCIGWSSPIQVQYQCEFHIVLLQQVTSIALYHMPWKSSTQLEVSEWGEEPAAHRDLWLQSPAYCLLVAWCIIYQSKDVRIRTGRVS